MRFTKGWILGVITALGLTVYAAKITDNDLLLGDNLDSDKQIKARNGDTNLPFLKYDSKR